MNPSALYRAAGFTLIELLVVVVIIVVLIGIGLSVGQSVVTSGKVSATRAVLANANLIAEEYRALTKQHVNHLHEDVDGDGQPANGEPQPFKWNMVDRTSPGSTIKKHNSPNTAPEAGSNRLASVAWGEGFQKDGGPYVSGNNSQPGDVKQKSIDRFVWATQQVKALQSLYATFDEYTLNDQDDELTNPTFNDGIAPQGFLELRDAWGNKLIYVAYVKDKDDYIGTGYNDEHASMDNFLPKSKTPYFVSAGPDGGFGHVHALVPAKGPTSEMQHYRAFPSEKEADYRQRLHRETMDNVYSNDLLGQQ